MTTLENDLYQELVLEHKRAPRNFGHLPHPTHQAQGTNPQCGDQVAVELQVQDGRVQDIRFSGQGCAICMASSSMMTEAVKGRDLAAHPYAAVTFPWYGLGRQVHVRGPVTKVTPQETAEYWSKRPRGSQLGAWASQQSQPIESRAALLDRLAAVTERFAGQEAVPVPPNWGGYRVAPEVVEFWQGRENRVHNRIRVFPPEPGTRIERLQP